MSPAELEIMRSVEDDLWWYRGLRKHVVQSITPPKPQFSLLDVGCGSGGMLAHLRAAFPHASLAGMDLMKRAIELTRDRNLDTDLVQGSADQLPFENARFDYVTALDVIASGSIDDETATREIRRVLRPAGTFIINVPALKFLRGSHDVATDMARRYTRSGLERLLRKVGFTIRSITYWNMSLLPAIAVARWASRSRAQQPSVRSDLAPMWPPLNRALTSLATAELGVSSHVSLPFGTSLFAVVQK